jgi:hypothetical protein
VKRLLAFILVAGEVQLMFATPVEVSQQVTTGRLKASGAKID